MDAPNEEFGFAGRLDELKAKGRLVVHGGHRPILVIYDRGRIFALDNRSGRNLAIEIRGANFQNSILPHTLSVA